MVNNVSLICVKYCILYKLIEMEQRNSKYKNMVKFATVCDKIQHEYNDHVIRKIDEIVEKDKNVVIGLDNLDTEVMVWCSASRFGRCRYKFVWADESISFKSTYVPYRHLRCSSCDLLKEMKYPCRKHYHFFANVKVNHNKIVKYMESKGIQYV